jgi:hypothetical protein
LWVVCGTILILVSLIFEAGRYSVYRAHPELSSTEAATAILHNIGKIMQLPSGTTTMMTINDAASAKRAQPFLVNAQNGDVLIVYTDAAEALLYRPTTNKLIAVGPIDNSAPGSPAAKAPAPRPTGPTNNATTTKARK